MERIYKIEKPYERTLWSKEKLEEYVQKQGEKIDPRDVRRLQLWKERTEITMEDLKELRNLKVVNTDFNKTLVLEANNVLDLHNISAHFGGINREVVWDRLAQLIYGVTPYAWADGIAAIQELRKYFFYKIAPYMTPQEFERIAQGSFDRFIERKCCKPYFLIMKRTGRAIYMPNSTYADETADGPRIAPPGLDYEDGVWLDPNYISIYRERNPEEIKEVLEQIFKATEQYKWKTPTEENNDKDNLSETDSVQAMEKCESGDTHEEEN